MSYFKFVYHFKPLLDAYHEPYKDKYYYWTGLQLVLRAVFFGLTALERNTNLMISVLLIGIIACLQGKLYPFKNKFQNIQELFLLMNLHTMFVVSLHSDLNRTVIIVLISLSALQLAIIVLKNSSLCKKYLTQSKCILNTKMKNMLKYFKKPVLVANTGFNIPLVPDKTYNYNEFREPLIGRDDYITHKTLQQLK